MSGRFDGKRGDPEEQLQDIVHWGDRIAQYIKDYSYEAFLGDIRTQDAVIWCLEVVGEAAGEILRRDAEFEARHPTIALAAAYRARNRTAHGYGSVDLATIWRSATVSAPFLVLEVRRLLAGQSGSNGQ
jgi:uncharacterized protein with HEPN domain